MNRILVAFLASTSALVMTAATNALAYGEIDTSYGATPIPGWTCAPAITPLPDDSVLVGLGRKPGPSPSYAVAKVRPDGTLDPAWQGGVAMLGGADPNPPATILPLPDGGAIVTTGASLTRLRSDGSVDTPYATQGHFGGAPGDRVISVIQSAALEADGSVVVLSHQDVGLGSSFSYLFHILPDGTWDKGFGNAGHAGIEDTMFTGESIYAWSVRDDGSVEVGYMHNEVPPHPVLRRFPVDFTDADRPKGRVMPRAGVASWVAPNVLVDAAGGAVFATTTPGGTIGEMGPFGRVSLIRFLLDGTVDAGFGMVPIVATDGGSQSSEVRALKLWRSAEGKWTLLVDMLLRHATFTSYVYVPETLVYRFDASGRPDSTFNQAQFVLAAGAARLNTGKLIVPGQDTSDCKLTRELTDGEPRVDGIMVEYFHPVLRHYFMTLDTFEAAGIDAVPYGWERTGRTFAAWQPVAAPATTPVCRFYGDPVIGPNSHFYTPEGYECDGLIALEHSTPPGVPVWHLEGKPFRASLPSADGTCPGNLDPVFRVFNGPVDNAHGPTHRYTTDPALYAQMQSLGWLPEGAHFCVPPLGPR